MCENVPGPAAALPGGTGVSLLKVYDVEAPDGLVGGTLHVHLACSEGYDVIAGSGAVQTLPPEHLTDRETYLKATTLAGSRAVQMLPPEDLTEPESYLKATILEGGAGGPGMCEVQTPSAKARRDLALGALEADRAPHLEMVEFHQITAPTEFGRHGVCGRLDVFDVSARL